MAQQDQMRPLTTSIDQSSLLKVAVDYPRYRVLSDGEACALQGSVITINPSNWQISIADPIFEEPLLTGDTGWRDVTAYAREDDPDVERAFLRRVGNQVRYAQRGRDLSALTQVRRRDLLAERCFGVPRAESLPLPKFLSGIEGFTPTQRVPEGE